MGKQSAGRGDTLQNLRHLLLNAFHDHPASHLAAWHFNHQAMGNAAIDGLRIVPPT